MTIPYLQSRHRCRHPSFLTAHENSLLVLLRSRPDTVRGHSLRKTKVSVRTYDDRADTVSKTMIIKQV